MPVLNETLEHLDRRSICRHDIFSRHGVPVSLVDFQLRSRKGVCWLTSVLDDRSLMFCRFSLHLDERFHRDERSRARASLTSGNVLVLLVARTAFSSEALKKEKHDRDAVHDLVMERSEMGGGIVNNEEDQSHETHEYLQSWEIEGCALLRVSSQPLCSSSQWNEQRNQHRSNYFFQIFLVGLILFLRFFNALFRDRFLSCLCQLDLNRERSIRRLSNVATYLQMFWQAVVRR